MCGLVVMVSLNGQLSDCVASPWKKPSGGTADEAGSACGMRVSDFLDYVP